MQQIDRIVQLYNKIIDRLKLKAFKLTLDNSSNGDIKEELAKKVLLS